MRWVIQKTNPLNLRHNCEAYVAKIIVVQLELLIVSNRDI